MKAPIYSGHMMWQALCFKPPIHCCQHFQELYNAGIDIPIVQIKKLRLIDVKYLAPTRQLVRTHASKVLSSALVYIKLKHSLL